ncbi:MAG: ATP-dependent Clp protease adaptor ClpS [Fimbriimonadales bacterium]
MSHKLEPKTLDPDQGFRGGYITIIFNNDANSFDEVVAVLVRATSCTIEEAQIETWEAHTFGKAAVHFGFEPECRRVATTISRIGVRTEVRAE